MRGAYTVAALLWIAGCGGGSGSGSAPTATATVAASATPTVAASATATTIATESPTPERTATPTTPATAPPTNTPPATATPVTPTAIPATATHTPAPTETPTETPTPTRPVGPLVSAFGLADTNGTFDEQAGTDPFGRPVFGRQTNSAFLIYVEGRPGASGLPVATNLLSSVRDSPVGRPDLQILSNRDLGNGSLEVCDKSFPDAGGVPAVDGADFALEQSVSDALNDLGCRFRVFTEPGFACTQDNNGNFLFESAGSTVQFCALVSDAIPFPAGDTVLTARLRDTAGNAGPAIEIVVRIRGS